MTSIKRPLRFRFRLTTLLSLMVVVAVAAAAYGNRLRTIERQEEAFRQIAAKGGIVQVYSYGTQIYFEQPPSTMCMNGIQRVLEPSQVVVSFGDRDCPLLNEIINLHSVHFPGSQVSLDGRIAFVCGHRDCRVSNKPVATW